MTKKSREAVKNHDIYDCIEFFIGEFLEILGICHAPPEEGKSKAINKAHKLLLDAPKLLIIVYFFWGEKVKKVDPLQN